MSKLQEKFEQLEPNIDDAEINEILEEIEEEDTKVDLEKQAKEAFAYIKEQEKIGKVNSQSLYVQWADKTYAEANLDSLTVRSKVLEFLGTTLVGNTKSLILAKWAWWTDADKLRCLPVMKPAARKNEINKALIYKTTETLRIHRNQFVNRFFGLAMGGAVALAFAIFGFMKFMQMQALGKTTFIFFVASIVFSLLKKPLKDKVPSYEKIRNALILSTAVLMIGQYSYSVYQGHKEQVQQKEQLAQQKHDVALTNINTILDGVTNNNKVLISNYDSNKGLVASRLNIFVNSELQGLVKQLADNKENLGSDYDSQAKKLVAVITEDVPVIQKLVNDGLIKPEEAMSMKSKVNEQLGKL